MAKKPASDAPATSSASQPPQGRLGAEALPEDQAMPGLATTTSFQDEQIAQLKDMVGALSDAVAAMQLRTAQKSALDDTVAELRLATRSLATMPAPRFGQDAVGVGGPSGCGDCECSCVAPGCCSFEIVLGRVRAAKPQIEPADMGDIPGLINALEVQIYASVNDVGVLLPGLGTTMDLRADGLPGGPGPWVVVERVVNRIYMPSNAPLSVELRAEVREHDEGIERPIGLKDEIGEASSWITLDCCTSKIYPAAPLDVYLTHGGEGRGMIQLAFYARKVCC